MFFCKVRGCLSDQNTKIDGREISLFAFPEDETRRQQWIKNCKLVLDSVEENESMYLCELHFEKTYFTASNELKTNAVPTVFRNGEDLQRKRKAENNVQIESAKIQPSKQKNIDEGSHSLVTPPQSPFAQLGENVEESGIENKVSQEPVNGSDAATSMSYKEMDIGKNIYRLTIQIEKIRAEPDSEIKDSLVVSNQEIDDFMNSNNEMLIFKNEPELFNEPPAEKIVKLSKVKKPPCIKGGCKLKKALYGSKPAFQCEECNKYYVMKKCNTQIEKTNVCSVCQKSFASPQSLYLHVKKHFVCDMCLTECSSRMSLDKHAKSHVSTDPLFPYKCHRCFEIFDTKDEIRNHYVLIHPSIKVEGGGRAKVSPVTTQVPKQEYLCPTCNITFRNEHAYRNHVNSHTQKEGIRCNIAEPSNIISVPNPLTGGQIGILRAVKFSCRVCSKEFDNVAEVDQHTRTHLENAEERKCNICKKMFKSAQLNEHLKHHLSRAHPCPICPKAFINRTTLKIHLKTHGDP